MKKRILAALAVLGIISLVFSGCTGITASGNFVQQLLGGIPMSTVYKGEIAETMETTWLDFRVDSVQFVDEFGGEVADDDSLFLLVNITERNTYKEATPLYTDDYFIDGIGMSNYEYPIYIDEESDTENPFEGLRSDKYELDVDESARWLLPFKVPKHITDFTFTYYEYYDANDVNEYMILFQK